MASGNTLVVFAASQGIPTATAGATPDVRNNQNVFDFNTTTDSSLDFEGVMPRHYAAGGVTVTLVWSASGVVANDVIWNAAFERQNDDAVDLDSDSFAAMQASAAATAPSVDGEVSYDTITFTNAQIDGLLAGESFRFRVTRDADNVGDTMAADAELRRVEIRET